MRKKSEIPQKGSSIGVAREPSTIEEIHAELKMRNDIHANILRLQAMLPELRERIAWLNGAVSAHEQKNTVQASVKVG